MKNYEKYAEQIKNYDGSNFCRDFIEPVILKEFNRVCNKIECGHCYMLTNIWLMEEYTESEVDWSKVEVDTPILVRDYEYNNWRGTYFAKFENGKVYAWANGRTSWTAKNSGDIFNWEYAKLAEGEDE